MAFLDLNNNRMMIKYVLKSICALVFILTFQLNAQEFLTHKVEEGDTVEALSKKYKVSANQIYDLNPDSKKGLKVKSVLIIPNVKAVKSNAVKVTQNLEKFTTHKVQRKETLYSLSKQYNTTEEAIKKYNSFLYANELKKGDELKIPLFKTEVKNEVKSEIISEVKPAIITDSVLPNGKYRVKKSEGKWRIAKNFGITVEELEALNPQLVDGLKENDIINVPKIKNTEIPSTTTVAIKTYTVLPAEGFFRLSQKLGLSQEQLETLNPGLKETGLKEGMVLNLGAEKVKPTNEMILVENQATNLGSDISNKDRKKIAIVLPFRLNTIQTDSLSLAKNKLENDKLLTIALDFYAGAEMALDSLKKMNVKLDVKVYDTNNRESNSLDIANELLENETDVVIGPLMTKNFDALASKLSLSNIPVFSPLTKEVAFSSNVFQTRPNESFLEQKIINYIKKDSTAHIVILHDSKHEAVAKRLEKAFPNAKVLTTNRNKKNGSDQFFIYEATLSNALNTGKNYVFLETEEEGFVSNVTSILNSKNNQTNLDIVLATTNMNEAFQSDNVSNAQLSRLRLMYPSIAKMFKSSSATGFYKNYEAKYNETPSSYAVRGFDLTMDVVLRLLSNTSVYDNAKNNILTEYLENKFMYSELKTGGFQNNAVYLVNYNDLNIEEVQE
ncbi:LysM peptidoglycan-binding domain-containing protein [Aurantibacter aestuarii]|nr:LysM peptidoglycan-binding domain-containing protein [Aurantibacter aestuarii]